ncbi:C2 family cysteine protease [Streptomyces sp. NPDC013457]|uniref:C2 family cysteine protease n=1 Tax=Streptomyces sp. NPDC013457 TaxID=3364866 RepID=UPI00370224F3
MGELHTADGGAEANPLPADAIENRMEHAEPEEPGELDSPGDPDDREVPEEPEAPEEPEDDPDAADDGPEPERAFLGDVFSKLRDTLAGPREPAEGPVDRYATVDRPDFNAKEIPDMGVAIYGYGTPLERQDGQRTPLFDGPPRRDQTMQGGIGDCGVIATMGAVAEHYPEAISERVKENEDGSYEVTLDQVKRSSGGGDLDRYEPTGAVTVLSVTPDLVVMWDRPDRPAYAQVEGGAAWPAVLEKAFAGVDQTWDEDRTGQLSGYERLNLGTKVNHRAEMLAQLTGRPAYTDDIPTQYDMDGVSPDRQLLATFREKLQDGCPILIGTRSAKDGPPLAQDLVAGHVYEVTEVDDRGRIHMRNPYNSFDPEPLTAEEFRKNCSKQYTTMGNERDQ